MTLITGSFAVVRSCHLHLGATSVQSPAVARPPLTSRCEPEFERDEAYTNVTNLVQLVHSRCPAYCRHGMVARGLALVK